MVKENIKNYLVLVVDIDDDIGRKAGLKTPILGREDNIKALIKLGLADPGDSDVNAILGGIKIYDELKASGKDVEIATISGDVNVESEKCALRLKEQIDFLMYLYNPDFIYLVSDGKEDEMILKYLESKNVFVWKKRVIVKQSETLESTYYLIQEFIKKTMEEYIPLILTFVGFSLILYAIFADIGWRIVVGIIGFYILSEGVGVRKLLIEKIKTKEEFAVGRVYPITGAISLFILIIGLTYSLSSAYKSTTPSEIIGNFLLHFVDSLVLSLLILMVGKFVDTVVHSEQSLLEIFKKYFFYLICIFISRELISTGGSYLLGKTSFITFVMNVILYISITIILSVILFTKTPNQGAKQG
jgi:putative membrane protein